MCLSLFIGWWWDSELPPLQLAPAGHIRLGRISHKQWRELQINRGKPGATLIIPFSPWWRSWHVFTISMDMIQPAQLRVRIRATVYRTSISTAWKWALETENHDKLQGKGFRTKYYGLCAYTHSITSWSKHPPWDKVSWHPPCPAGGVLRGALQTCAGGSSTGPCMLDMYMCRRLHGQ